MELLDADSAFVELHDQRWVDTAALLDGTSWFTTVSREDAELNILPTNPNLILFGWWLIDHTVCLPSGEPLDEVDGVSGDLVGPVGWLQPFAEQTIVVSIVENVLYLDLMTDPITVNPALVDVLSSTFDELAKSWFDDGPRVMMTDSLVWEALAADRGAFLVGPIPPLDDWMRSAQLERHDQQAGYVGTDWYQLEEISARRRLHSEHGLDDDQADRYEILIAACNRLLEGENQPLGPPDHESSAARALAMFLTDPKVATAFWSAHLERQTEPNGLMTFGRLVLAHAPQEFAFGTHWLIGRALDHAGLAVEAEVELRLGLDGAQYFGFPHLSRSLAAFAADRGDAAGALKLLRAAETDNENELLQEVVGYATVRPKPTAARNDRCPCGSGRKYKVCHAGKEQISLIDRGPWLYAKARRYLRDNRDRRLTAEIAGAVAQASGRGGLFILDLLDTELVADLALCEGGVFEQFLAQRHSLLPDDEALLGDRWELVERSLFEVEKANFDSVSMRDLRTGDRLTVTNSNPHRNSRPGTLLLGRPLPIANTWRAYPGFVEIGRPVMDNALAVLDHGSLWELAAMIGRSFAAPVLRNTDGQDTVLHELTYQLPTPSATQAALSTELQSGDGISFSLVRDSKNQRDTVIISLELQGDHLIVATNSNERTDEAIALVERLIPNAILVDHDQREVGEWGSGAGPDDPQLEPALTPDDPQVAEFLQSYILDYEQRWVNEPVPALRGMTPREAAADPIGRFELEQLLQSFPQDDGHPGRMSPMRLRANLNM